MVTPVLEILTPFNVGLNPLKYKTGFQNWVLQGNHTGPMWSDQGWVCQAPQEHSTCLGPPQEAMQWGGAP